MQTGTKTLRAWIAITALSAGAYGAGGLACSSNTTSSTSGGDASTGGNDTGTGTDNDGGGGGDSGSGTDSGGDAGAGSDCGTPAVLHAAKADGGIFCPFSGVDGGKNLDCPRTDQCCETPKGGGASTCVTKGTACPVTGSTVWECEAPQDCPTSQVCCGVSGDAGAVTIKTDTCGAYLSKFSGTHCAASCGTGEVVVCEQQADCSSGTCTAVKPKGNDIGVCK